MGGRYWISGVQLGMLKATQSMDDHPDYANDILSEIENNQFIGNIDPGENKRVELVDGQCLERTSQ